MKKAQGLNSYGRIPPSDNGCKEYGDCLTCPYPFCKDEGHKPSAASLRHSEVTMLLSAGMSKVEVAERLGVSVTTVRRALKGRKAVRA